jgi:hypothetical protein
MSLCPHGDVARHCDICKANPVPVQPAVKQVSRLGWNPLSYREPIGDFNADEVHAIVWYHWKESENVWFRDNVTSEEFFLKQFPRMVERFKFGYTIPTKTIVKSNPACEICSGTGEEEFTEVDSHTGRKYDMVKECACVQKQVVEIWY